jgi:hypothetical protein
MRACNEREFDFIPYLRGQPYAKTNAVEENQMCSVRVRQHRTNIWRGSFDKSDPS